MIHYTGESKKKKRKSSPKYKRIKFFHDENTDEAREAKKERTSHQLLVLGLPRAPLDPTPPTAGPQEKKLNELMEGLGKKMLGEDGINVVQENVIGAYQLDPPAKKRRLRE